MPDYGKKLKEIRQHLSLTQDEMAKKLGLASRAYSAYERNENKPPLSMLDMIHLNFDINLNWFISDRGNMLATPQNTSADKDEIIKIVEDYLAKRDNELNR